jgi:hypothetical protein
LIAGTGEELLPFIRGGQTDAIDVEGVEEGKGVLLKGRDPLRAADAAAAAAAAAHTADSAFPSVRPPWVM